MARTIPIPFDANHIAHMQRSRWFVLALLGTAELLGMCLWFSASAVAPHFRTIWHLDNSQTAWLTTIVQLGFVGGTAIAATFNLADIIPSRIYFAVAALGGAIVNAALLAAHSYHAALFLRFMTGLLLAGVYPPAMKMIATWFQSSRGLAIGTIVGALTLGKALPYLLNAIPSLDYRGVIIASSAGAALAALIVVIGYDDGPYPFVRRAFSFGLVPTVFADRRTRLAILGYLGHMWELYAAWFSMNAFFTYVFSTETRSVTAAAETASIMAFIAIAAGAIGSVIAGAFADRIGRANVAIGAMLISAACALTLGWVVTLPVVVVITIALLWGITIVADSAQFSAIVTEVAPPHAVGTALTLQTSLGFALTAVSISLTGHLATSFGWGIAFSTLAIGPLLGVMAMRTFRNA